MSQYHGNVPISVFAFSKVNLGASFTSSFVHGSDALGDTADDAEDEEDGTAGTASTPLPEHPDATATSATIAAGSLRSRVITLTPAQ